MPQTLDTLLQNSQREEFAGGLARKSAYEYAVAIQRLVKGEITLRDMKIPRVVQWMREHAPWRMAVIDGCQKLGISEGEFLGAGKTALAIDIGGERVLRIRPMDKNNILQRHELILLPLAQKTIRNPDKPTDAIVLEIMPKLAVAQSWAVKTTAPSASMVAAANDLTPPADDSSQSRQALVEKLAEKFNDAFHRAGVKGCHPHWPRHVEIAPANIGFDANGRAYYLDGGGLELRHNHPQPSARL